MPPVSLFRLKSRAIRIVVGVGHTALSRSAAVADTTDRVSAAIEIVRALGGGLAFEIAAITVATVLVDQAR